MLVFANGVSLGDGSTLDAWRRSKPIALDEFEQVFNPPWFGLPGAIALGIFCFLIAISGSAHQTVGAFWSLVLVLSFVFPAGWWMLVVAFIRWLRTKRTWPWRLRRLMVMALVFASPFVILVVFAVAAAAAGITK